MPTAVGDQIVASTLGSRLGQRAVVGDANVEGRHRRGERQEQDGGADGGTQAFLVTCSPPPPRPHRGATGRVVASQAEAVDPVFGKTKERGQQRDRGDHHDQHDDRDGHPAAVTNGTPATARPSIAMTTVPPAKTTAWPAVATARPADSWTVIPRRGTRGADDDEQGVVDAHPDADLRRQAEGAHAGMSIR